MFFAEMVDNLCIAGFSILAKYTIMYTQAFEHRFKQPVLSKRWHGFPQRCTEMSHLEKSATNAAWLVETYMCSPGCPALDNYIGELNQYAEKC